jgi:hypothetical protein
MSCVLIVVQTIILTAMTDFVIAIYCFIDDFYKQTGSYTDPKCKVSDAEILTTALVAARYFGGNHAVSRNYMWMHHGVNMIHKGGFSRRLFHLEPQLVALYVALGQTLKELNISSEYLIDSFPVAVCHNIRIKNSKLLKGHEAYRGKCAAKREYFYGFRVQVITTADGIPVDYFIGAGAFVDITAFQSMNVDLPEGSTLYADSGYTLYELEELFEQCEGVKLQVARKGNSTRKHSPALDYTIPKMRKRVETTFSEITAWFPKKIHATTAKGFMLIIILLLFAVSLNKTIM